jgi:hypothetical protein
MPCIPYHCTKICILRKAQQGFKLFSNYETLSGIFKKIPQNAVFFNIKYFSSFQFSSTVDSVCHLRNLKKSRDKGRGFKCWIQEFGFKIQELDSSSTMLKLSGTFS